jgi:ABC-type antimicrobial peptide transport system permease subunit
MNLVIASAAPLQQAATVVERALAQPGVRVYEVRPLADHVERSFWQVRWEAGMLGVFGGLALSLAAVGLYGAMAYYVTQRTRELGIRMALGAGTRGVLWCVCARGLRLTAIGVAIGVPLSVAAGRLLSGFIHGVMPIGWDSLAASATLWIAIAGLACVVPAARASRIPAVLALRQE